MANSNNENEFYSNLKKQFSKNDYINLNSSFVPKNSSNKLNRFYDGFMWFSRLKISNDDSIYYFGLNDMVCETDNVYPSLILRYCDSVKKSSIIFSKNNVLLLIKISKDSMLFNILRNSFKMLYATKNKNSNYYYINLGTFDSDEFKNNIKYLLNIFKFELNVNKREVVFNDIKHDFVNLKNQVNENYMLDTLKFNLKVIEIKDIIFSLNYNKDILKGIEDYLFCIDEHGDYSFNIDIKKPDDVIFDCLKKVLCNLDCSDYKSIINKISIELNNL